MSAQINSNSDDDVARLFRENDHLGPDSSLWLRPFRQLIQDGKPVGRIVGLTFSSADGAIGPVGTLTYTQKDRLIFWPAFPPDAKMCVGNQIVDIFDHLTLEFPSEKMHVTAYQESGKPVRSPRQGWRTVHFPEAGLAIWFTMLVKNNVIAGQHSAIQRKVRVAKSDKKRLTAEFTRCMQRMQLVSIRVPETTNQPDFYYCAFYLVPGGRNGVNAAAFPAFPSLTHCVDGCPDGSKVRLETTAFEIEDRLILVAVGCPPGSLRGDLVVGFPRRGG